MKKKNELSLNMYVCKFKGEWFHSAYTERSPEGCDMPAGPFKTFRAAAKDFAKAIDAYADWFVEEEKVK